MAIARATLVKGPALVTRNGVNLYTTGDIQIAFETESEDVNVSLYGKVDEIALGHSAKITFTPTSISESFLTETHPYFGFAVGTSIFGTDEPLTIQTVAGKKLVFSASALTKIPSMLLSVKGEPLGEMEYTCIRADNTEPTAANSFVTITSEAWVDPAELVLASRLRGKYTAAWAASGAWAAFSALEGFTLECDLKTQDWNLDAEGLVDMSFAGLEVRVKGTPVGSGATPIAEAEIVAAMNLQGTGAARGTTMSALPNTHDLVITGNAATALTPKQHLVATLKGAALKTAGMRFGETVLRNNECGWIATRTIASGTVSPLASLALT